MARGNPVLQCRASKCTPRRIRFSAITGSSTTLPNPFVYPDDGKAKSGQGKFKIGVIKGAANNVQPEVKKNFEDSLKVLTEFAEIVENVALPDLPFGEAVSTIVDAEGASAMRDLIESGQASKLRDSNDKFGGYGASMVLAVDYLQAMRVRGPMKKAMDELYAQYDALVAPSRGTVAMPIDKSFDKGYPGVGGGPPVIPAGNTVGQPAISVPNGFGLHDLPTGIQFTGRAGSEARLIAVANAFQQRTDWHKKRPPLQA